MNGVLLGTLMYKSGLVPKAIPLMGLVGGPLLLVLTIASMVGVTHHGSPWWVVAAPIVVWEFSLACYLLVKGFRPSPLTAEMVTGSGPR